MTGLDDAEADLAPRRRRLPDVALPPLSGGAAVPLRAPRRGTVLVVLDGAGAEGDRAYVRRLAGAGPALGEWDGRVLVVADGAAAGAADAGLTALTTAAAPFPALGDPGRVVAAAAGVTAPALVVADQWGEVHAATAVGPDRRWPEPGEVEQWLRYLAIRCAG